MMGVSRGAVVAAAVVLVGAAGVGSYLGYSRAAAAPGGDADQDADAVTPVNAKRATAADAAPPPVDETYIRKIAHDEALSILHPPQAAPKKVAVAKASDDSDDSDDSDSGSAPSAHPPTPPPTAAAVAPVAAKPPPPPTGLY